MLNTAVFSTGLLLLSQGLDMHQCVYQRKSLFISVPCYKNHKHVILLLMCTLGK